MCEVRECDRKLASLYCERHALAYDEATGRPRRKGDAGLHLEVIAISLLWPGILMGLFCDYPSSAAGNFASVVLYGALVAICLVAGELSILIDVAILRRHRIFCFGWLYDIYRYRDDFLEYFLEDENLSDVKGYKEVKVLLDQEDLKRIG